MLVQQSRLWVLVLYQAFQDVPSCYQNLSNKDLRIICLANTNAQSLSYSQNSGFILLVLKYKLSHHSARHRYLGYYTE